MTGCRLALIGSGGQSLPIGAVREVDDVRRLSETYAAMQAGLVLLVVVAAQHLHGHLWHF